MLRIPFFALFVLLRVGLPEAGVSDVNSTQGSKCTNLGWRDKRRQSCRDYRRKKYCNADGTYGPGWRRWMVTFEAQADRRMGRTAVEACCACGGGVKGCRNMNWRDSRGNKCNKYVRKGWCTTNGKYGLGWRENWGSFKNFRDRSSGMTADVACCGCGGGLRDSSASAAVQCQLPPGPHFGDAYGTCGKKQKGKHRKLCNSVCDCPRQKWDKTLTCGCQDKICQQQCPNIPQQAVSFRRRSWKQIRRQQKLSGGVIGAAFTFRRRHCVGDGKGPVYWTPRRRRRRCRALPVNDPVREIIRPLKCSATVVPGYLDARAFGNTGCRKDEAMCLRWNRTSRSFWVFGLAMVNNENARCIGLNTQWAAPANYFTLKWVSTPGRFFLAAHRSKRGAGRYVTTRSGELPNLPWHSLNSLQKPPGSQIFRNLTQCCTWMDPTREQHVYCEADRMCQIPSGVGTSTCQYELCSIDQNDNDPKCKGYLNPAKDSMCKCRDTDQPLAEPILVAPR